MGRPDPPISNHGLPHDAEYADDVDLNDEVNLKRILPVASAYGYTDTSLVFAVNSLQIPGRVGRLQSNTICYLGL